MKNGKHAPAHLSDEAKRLWKTLTAEYNITDSGGLSILRAGLEARDRATGAREAIDRDGLSINDRWGVPRAHPLASVERDAQRIWLAALKQLCLDIEPLRDRPGRPPGR
jgi:P27 family predicted phage terminase small subunit